MMLSFDFDVFFNECVTAEMLEKLGEWAGFPVTSSDWAIIEYANGDCSYFVNIKTEQNSPEKIIKALWDNLKIPLIAYWSTYSNFDSCMRWAADSDGIKNILISVES